MILILYIIVIFLLFFQTFFLKKIYRNNTSPSFYFSATWTIVFISYAILWRQLPHLHLESILIFLFGVTFFNLGGLITAFTFPSKIYAINFEYKYDKKILKFAIIFSIFLLPLYFNNLISKYSIDEFFTNILFGFNNIRRATVEDLSYGSKLDLINNLPIFSNFIFLATFIFLPMKRENYKYFLSSFILNLIYNSLNGSKMSIITSILVVFIIITYKNKRINYKYLFWVLFFLISLFGLLVYLINYTFVNFQDNNNLFSEILNTVEIYMFGGPIAFDYYISNHLYFGNNQSIYRPFIELLRSLGFDLKIDSRNSEYITSGSISTNVYTIYYSLYDTFGVFITMIFMFFYGILFESIYILCKNGHRLFSIFYPMIIISSLFSIHAEQFISGTSVIIKFSIFYFILFKCSKYFLNRFEIQKVKI